MDDPCYQFWFKTFIKESFAFHNPQNVCFCLPFFGDSPWSWSLLFVCGPFLLLLRQEYLDAKMDADAVHKTRLDLRREVNKSAEVKDLVLKTRDALESSSTATSFFTPGVAGD